MYIYVCTIGTYSLLHSVAINMLRYCTKINQYCSIFMSNVLNVFDDDKELHLQAFDEDIDKGHV